MWEDLALVEVVDEHNQSALPGTPGLRVLLTNLVNRTQPLIRYEISARGGPHEQTTHAEADGPATRPARPIQSAGG